MRLKLLKVLVIAIILIAVVLINAALHGGENGPVNPILSLACIAFIGAVWKYKPKTNDDKHLLKKD